MYMDQIKLWSMSKIKAGSQTTVVFGPYTCMLLLLRFYVYVLHTFQIYYWFCRNMHSLRAQI